MPNGEIFVKALSEDRVVLTSDLDFGEIAAALKDTAGKVVLLRLQNSRAANVTRRLSSVLPRVERDLAAGAVVIVEESRQPIRLPCKNWRPAPDASRPISPARSRRWNATVSFACTTVSAAACARRCRTKQSRSSLHSAGETRCLPKPHRWI